MGYADSDKIGDGVTMGPARVADARAGQFSQRVDERVVASPDALGDFSSYGRRCLARERRGALTRAQPLTVAQPVTRTNEERRRAAASRPNYLYSCRD
ncbi:hypothetical protein EVAR_38350_1 [Eumeta japonica]|uniref:Uncharacterized protein n=1 Tax=Eumeta variegata TaxID=151549 RepID=A0A4C1XZ93_EUMVA|nr:hypothetical protein EVAR_38350_1 [Eumeta japonica]